MLKKIILFVLIFFAAYLLWDELKSDDTASPNTTEVQSSSPEKKSTQQLPEGFEEFYRKFHTDSLFQISHIRFPLPGQQAMVVQKGLDNDGFHWDKSSWKMHRMVGSDVVSTEQEWMVTDDGMVREWLSVSGSGMAIERHWKPKDGSWQMIYYSDLNTFE